MFDAKSLLEALVTGAGQRATPQAQSQPSLGGLGDLLGQVLGGAAGGGGRGAGAQPGQGGGLEDLLKGMLPGGGDAQRQGGGGGGGGLEDLLRNMVPGSGAGQGGGAGGGGGLGDILGKLQQQMGQGGAGAGGGAAGGLGGLGDLLGQVFGQAKQGVQEGAGRINDMTGIGDRARDAVGQMSGKSPEDLMAQLKELIANNQLGAGAALGGLGALVLGTKTGRSAAATAAKLGALALIGGLAYKALQNYSSGRPPVTGPNFAPEAAPGGSGFEPQAITNEAAALYIRAMIAAAAADGRIDGAEQQKILGGLKQAGVDAEAEEFLATELNNPATAEQLAGAVRSQEEAVQVFTAARIAIEPDTAGEHRFLSELASHLGIDRNLAAYIDAAARSSAA